jgi:hypothetical protein
MGPMGEYMPLLIVISFASIAVAIDDNNVRTDEGTVLSISPQSSRMNS